MTTNQNLTPTCWKSFWNKLGWTPPTRDSTRWFRSWWRTNWAQSLLRFRLCKLKANWPKSQALCMPKSSNWSLTTSSWQILSWDHSWSSSKQTLKTRREFCSLRTSEELCANSEFKSGDHLSSKISRLTNIRFNQISSINRAQLVIFLSKQVNLVKT